jgi:AcrR family transcriptional regulator
MNRRTSARVLPRKEREKRARQEEILTAARALFALKGYHNTTLEEIAHHAEFGKGTIYNYFSSKEELFYGIIDQLTAETVELALASIRDTNGTAREKLTAYAVAMISHARANAELVNLIIREINHVGDGSDDIRMKIFHLRARKVWETIAQPIKDEIRSNGSKQVDAVRLAAMFDGMLRFHCIAQYGKFRLLENENIAQAVSSIVSVFFDGIANYKE